MKPILIGLLAMACATGTPAQPPPPVTIPVTVVTPAHDASVDACDRACASAQKLCPHPTTLEHCVGVCEAAGKNLTAPGIDCIAKTATCDLTCP